MPALMPRCSACVLCGQPIQGKGRIDRIYCSASCRTLAWRARAGHRFDGRRKAKLPPQPGDYVARKALPLVAVRMKVELDAAKRRIAELEKRLGERRGDAASTATKLAETATAAGAVVLTAALAHRRSRRQRAEQDRVPAEVEVQQQRHRAELAAERERAARREAELQQQIAALAAGSEQTAARARATATAISTLNQTTDSLRQQLSDDANQTWQLYFEIAGVRRELAEARAQSNRNCAAFLEEARQRKNLQWHLTEAQQQLGSELAEWQTAYAQLAHNAREGQGLLDADNSQLRAHLAELKARAATAETALTTLQTEASERERLYREYIEQIQIAAAQKNAPQPRKQLANPARKRKKLPATKKPKQLPAENEHRQLSERSGIVETVVMTAVGVAGAVAGLGAGLLLGGSDKKRLQSKDVGTHFEVIPVDERKRLPPHR